MRFKKGHIPWHKGTKGLIKANSGSFKKGQTNYWKGKKTNRIPWNKGKKYNNPKISLANKGKHYSTRTEFKKKKWKFNGTLNEYRALHKRIAKKFGTPTKCEDCGKDGLTGKLIHWANIDGLYKEEYIYWKRLCVKCHWLLDKN